MLASNTKVSPNAAVLVTEVGQGIVLLSLVTRNYYTLNESGAHIWRGLRDGLNVGEIGQHLQDRYDVAAEHAEQSATTLLQALIAEQLVTL